MHHDRPSSTAGSGGRAVVTALVVSAWLVTVAIPPVLFVRGRAGWLEELDRPEQQAQWDEFRRDMAEQSGRAGPVQRKVPKSAEPPVRVWLRDHAALAVSAWVLFVGVLGGFFSLLVVGALRGEAGGDRSLAQDQSGRQRDHDEEDQRDAENTKQ